MQAATRNVFGASSLFLFFLSSSQDFRSLWSSSVMMMIFERKNFSNDVSFNHITWTRPSVAVQKVLDPHREIDPDICTVCPLAWALQIGGKESSSWISYGFIGLSSVSPPGSFFLDVTEQLVTKSTSWISGSSGSQSEWIQLKLPPGSCRRLTHCCDFLKGLTNLLGYRGWRQGKVKQTTLHFSFSLCIREIQIFKYM